jgi:hypothetical protein
MSLRPFPYSLVYGIDGEAIIMIAVPNFELERTDHPLSQEYYNSA